MEGPKCLQCYQPLDQDFGISTCARCGSMMMIDMDGQVHRAQGSAKLNSSEASENNHLSADIKNGEVQQSESTMLPHEPEQQDGQTQEQHSEIGEVSLEAQDASVFSEPVATANDNYNWFDQQLDQQDSASAAPETAAEAFADIASFGNQDQEIDALQFDVVLGGIDHKDLAAEVYKVLSDNRLFLNSKELVPTNGTLILSGISAARASLIVTRLKHLKIQISWSQKIYEN